MDLSLVTETLTDTQIAVALVGAAGFLVCLPLKIIRWLSNVLNAPTSPSQPRKPRESQGGSSSPGCSRGRMC